MKREVFEALRRQALPEDFDDLGEPGEDESPVPVRLILPNQVEERLDFGAVNPGVLRKVEAPDALVVAAPEMQFKVGQGLELVGQVVKPRLLQLRLGNLLHQDLCHLLNVAVLEEPPEELGVNRRFAQLDPDIVRVVVAALFGKDGLLGVGLPEPSLIVPVDGRLDRIHFAGHHPRRLGWQILEHLFLPALENKRLQDGASTADPLAVKKCSLGHGRQGDLLVEQGFQILEVGLEEIRLDELEKGNHLHEVVLHRRTGQDKAPSRCDAKQIPIQLRLWVLHLVAFVEHGDRRPEVAEVRNVIVPRELRV